jgi:hypothetical protein
MKNPYIVAIISLLVLSGVYYGLERFFDLRPLAEQVKDQEDLVAAETTPHSIPLNEVISGGPGIDGIPSIDDPQFESVQQADTHLSDTLSGVNVMIDGTRRFYPFQILVWHEVVNDVIDGVPVAVTYSPLTQSVAVFDRRLGDTVLEFGVSGMLYNNNLLMYDRETKSLWSQILGKGVVGERKDAPLRTYPFSIMTWADFRAEYPSAEVLSRKTGAIRDYTTDPYAEYHLDPIDIWFPLSNLDDRLDPKALVYGVINNGTPLAVPVIEDGFVPEEYMYAYWFAWVAMYPDTQITAGDL